MKANLSRREPEILDKWEGMGLYGLLREQSKGRPLYILHDGPPYANGHIHLGTALNKILKDMIVKSRQMSGLDAVYVPGWDCHGLPIEHQVDRELGKRKASMTQVEIRQHCRRYAERFIDIQRNEFKRLGVLGEWDNPYLTMSYGYEATIARELGHFFERGSVIRSKKPIYWCASCRTALAEAEVEYHNHVSPSIYVKFPLNEKSKVRFPEFSGSPFMFSSGRRLPGPFRPIWRSPCIPILTMWPWPLLVRFGSWRKGFWRVACVFSESRALRYCEAFAPPTCRDSVVNTPFWSVKALSFWELM